MGTEFVNNPQVFTSPITALQGIAGYPTPYTTSFVYWTTTTPPVFETFYIPLTGNYSLNSLAAAYIVTVDGNILSPAKYNINVVNKTINIPTGVNPNTDVAVTLIGTVALSSTSYNFLTATNFNATNFLITNLTAVNDIISQKGVYAVGAFAGQYTDGIVVDYNTGLGGISVGPDDDLGFYSGGYLKTNTVYMSSNGSVGIGTKPNSTYGRTLHIYNSAAPFQIARTDVFGGVQSPQHASVKVESSVGSPLIQLKSGSGNLNGAGYQFIDSDGNLVGQLAMLPNNINGTLSLQVSGKKTALAITSAGRVGIGVSEPGSMFTILADNIQPVNIYTYSDTEGSIVRNARARGTSAAPTATQDSDIVGGLASYSYTGTAWSNSINNGPNAGIFLRAKNIQSSTNIGTVIGFNTTNTNNIIDSTNVERMRIDSNGNVGINTTSPNKQLTVIGSISSTNDTYINGTLYTGTRMNLSPDGTGMFWFKTPNTREGVNTSNQVWDNGISYGIQVSGVASGISYPYTHMWYTSGFERMRVDVNGNVGVGNYDRATVTSTLQVSGSLATYIPVSAGGVFTIQPYHNSIICYNTTKLNLPAANTCPGRWLHVKCLSATVVYSGNTNVQPLSNTQLGNFIIPQTGVPAIGKWTQLQSDGNVWVVMAGA